MDPSFVHDTLGYYGMYAKRAGHGVTHNIYVFGASPSNDPDPDVVGMIPDEPNTDKRYKYAGDWVSFEGISVTSLSMGEQNSLAQQVVNKLNEKDPGKWRIF